MDSSSSADQDSAELPTEEDFYSVYHVKTRKRTSRHQFRVLEDQFAHNPKPSATVRKHIAAQLEMTARGVQVWFQNRRAKAKAQLMKERHIVPTPTREPPVLPPIRFVRIPTRTVQPPPPTQPVIEKPTPASDAKASLPEESHHPSLPQKLAPPPQGLGLSRLSYQLNSQQQRLQQPSPVMGHSLLSIRRGSLPSTINYGDAYGSPPDAVSSLPRSSFTMLAHPYPQGMARRQSLPVNQLRQPYHPYASALYTNHPKSAGLPPTNGPPPVPSLPTLPVRPYSHYPPHPAFLSSALIQPEQRGHYPSVASSVHLAASVPTSDWHSQNGSQQISPTSSQQSSSPASSSGYPFQSHSSPQGAVAAGSPDSNTNSSATPKSHPTSPYESVPFRTITSHHIPSGHLPSSDFTVGSAPIMAAAPIPAGPLPSSDFTFGSAVAMNAARHEDAEGETETETGSSVSYNTRFGSFTSDTSAASSYHPPPATVYSKRYPPGFWTNPHCHPSAPVSQPSASSYFQPEYPVSFVAEQRRASCPEIVNLFANMGVQHHAHGHHPSVPEQPEYFAHHAKAASVPSHAAQVNELPSGVPAYENTGVAQDQSGYVLYEAKAVSAPVQASISDGAGGYDRSSRDAAIQGGGYPYQAQDTQVHSYQAYPTQEREQHPQSVYGYQQQFIGTTANVSDERHQSSVPVSVQHSLHYVDARSSQYYTPANSGPVSQHSQAQDYSHSYEHPQRVEAVHHYDNTGVNHHYQVSHIDGNTNSQPNPDTQPGYDPPSYPPPHSNSQTDISQHYDPTSTSAGFAPIQQAVSF